MLRFFPKNSGYTAGVYGLRFRHIVSWPSATEVSLQTLPVLFLSTAENIHCQAAAFLTQVGLVLVVTSSGIIFIFRTSLLWSDDWNVRGALSGLMLVVTGGWIDVATQYRAVVTPTPLFGSICRMLPTTPWLPLGNAVFTSFLNHRVNLDPPQNSVSSPAGLACRTSDLSGQPVVPPRHHAHSSGRIPHPDHLSAVPARSPSVQDPSRRCSW
ncbi:hypothetical protein B0H14DRAFT_361849 [Mycena olivaceomarginata]|nr:hypothetical protein B0H14DRAFT_361849 [Mycena olivaceomarginata]